MKALANETGRERAPLPAPGSRKGCGGRVRILVKLYNRCLSQALSRFLQQQEEFQVRDAKSADETFSPSLLLTDLPTLEEAGHADPVAGKIILFDEGLDASQIERALSIPNVVGLIRNGCDESLLIKAIHCVDQGEIWLDTATVKTLLGLQRNHGGSGPTVHLTLKEKQIVELLLQGLKNKEIASNICLSESTVKVYVSRLYRKYQVPNRAQLIRKLTASGQLH